MWEVHSENWCDPVGTRHLAACARVGTAKSILVCPQDSTHKPRQTREGVCVPYLKDMSDFVCVCVNVLA